MNSIINSYLRCLSTILYVAIFLVGPLAILWGPWGGVVGTALTATLFLVLRIHAERRILLKLHATKVSRIEYPVVFGIAEEHARRFSIPLPTLCLIRHSAPNIATFRFSENHSLLILTEGLLRDLDREALSSIIARATAELWHPHSRCHALLSRLLVIFDRPEFKTDHVTFASRRFHSLRHFLLQLVVYPLHVIPIYLLTSRGLATELDDISTRISHLPRELAESLRFLVSQRHLNPLNVPLSTNHLFLVPPPPRHPVAQLLLDLPSLLPRIQLIESRQKILIPS